MQYILWALPKGSDDRLDERPMTSFPLTLIQVENVKSAASKDGWHGFRLQEDNGAIPDFSKCINRK